MTDEQVQGHAWLVRAGRRPAGLSGPRYLLAVVLLAVLASGPMLIAIGTGGPMLEPPTRPAGGVSRPFLPPDRGSTVIAPDPVRPSGRATSSAADPAPGTARAACAAKAADLAQVCQAP